MLLNISFQEHISENQEIAICPSMGIRKPEYRHLQWSQKPADNTHVEGTSDTEKTKVMTFGLPTTAGGARSSSISGSFAARTKLCIIWQCVHSQDLSSPCFTYNVWAVAAVQDLISPWFTNMFYHHGLLRVPCFTTLIYHPDLQPCGQQHVNDIVKLKFWFG